MLILGIDTATRIASVGLVRDGTLLTEESCPAVSNHTDTLIPLITSLLTHSGVGLSEIQGIGVSTGPGSFTGLRIALSTAKGLAYALGQKVVSVSTLEALALTITDWQGTICPLLDARKGEVYAAFFRRSQDGLCERLTPDQVYSPPVLLEQCSTPCLFLGDGGEIYEKLIREHCGSEAQILPFASHSPRGTVVAWLAWKRLRQGDYDDLSSLEPCYVRKPDAEFKRIN